MKAVFLVLAGCLALVMLVAAESQGGDRAPDRARLVGFWEVVKSAEAPPGSTVQFTNDGKLILTFQEGGKAKKLEATYQLKGDKLTTTRKTEVNHLTIKTLTDTSLVTVNEKGQREELKKKVKK